jgi:hypothetical protein
MINVRSIAIIVSSIFIFSAATALSLRFFRNHQEKKILSDAYIITKIVQTGPEKEALPTVYLTELLDLSLDQPQRLYSFDEEERKQKILGSPVISEAKIKKVKPDTIYIDYTLRQPIAFLADFANTAIDGTGAVFPLTPFYTPKRLPEIYLGLESYTSFIKGKKIDLAMSLLKLIYDYFPDSYTSLKWLDVSEAFSDSYGKREIVVIFQKEGGNHYLRLNPKNYGGDLGSYLSLKEELWHDEIDRVIDLRIAKLAYIEEHPRKE